MESFVKFLCLLVLVLFIILVVKGQWNNHDDFDKFEIESKMTFDTFNFNNITITPEDLDKMSQEEAVRFVLMLEFISNPIYSNFYLQTKEIIVKKLLPERLSK